MKHTELALVRRLLGGWRADQGIQEGRHWKILEMDHQGSSDIHLSSHRTPHSIQFITKLRELNIPSAAASEEVKGEGEEEAKIKELLFWYKAVIISHIFRAWISWLLAGAIIFKFIYY